jgi:trehalose 6-phosphate phosphatase
VFLDVDGTLLEIAPAPEAVVVPGDLPSRLRALERGLGGALALVSGRPIAQIDDLFAPERFTAAGVHGAEIRRDEALRLLGDDPAGLDPARRAFAEFAAAHDGTRWEDKRFAVTLHFRQRPDVGAAAEALAGALASQLGDMVHVLAGKMVVEIRFRAATKATAVASLLAEPPFAGRRPVYIGDDVTDEDAFAEVNGRGGISVVVGPAMPASCAHVRVATVSDVHAWLDSLTRHLESSP